MSRPVLLLVSSLLVVPVRAAEPAKADKPVPVAAVVETTLTTDGDKIRQFAFDGSADTYFTSTTAPTEKDSFTLKFDKPVTVKSVKVVTGKPKGGGELSGGVLSGSADGTVFDPLAKFADGTASVKPEKKLTALRIEFLADAKEPLLLREITLETDPPVAAFKNPVEIKTDSTDAPELKEWFENVAMVCEKQYPMICDELKSDGHTPPTRITMTLKKSYDGVAYAQGNKIVGSVKYFEKHKDDVGAFVHETAHCVQQYRGRGNPPWLMEGVADYVRFFKYEAKKPAKLAPERAKYDGSYRTTAAFLDFLVETQDKEIVRKLNETMRKGKFTDTTWKDLTGKTVEELGREWQKSLAK